MPKLSAEGKAHQRKLKKRIAVYHHWTGQVDWTRLLHRSEHLHVTFM